MKHTIFTIIFFLFAGTLFSQWVNQITPTGFNVLSCSFPSVTSGFAVGYGNLILKTTNGGGNWADISFQGTANNLNSVWFINTNTGWIASTNDTLYKTTDNGLSWNASFSMQSQGTKIFFINQQTGW